MLGFNPGIQKHKALAHDMYIGSNALQRRFVPQPVLRSSWLQLVKGYARIDQRIGQIADEF